jgi:hypothetical protein
MPGTRRSNSEQLRELRAQPIGPICRHCPSVPPTIRPVNGKPHDHLPCVHYAGIVIEHPHLGVLDPLGGVGAAPAGG